jgi:hypothetical protein
VKRYAGMDVLRGLGMMGVVFLHASLYHYAKLLEIDFANPPAIVIVIGLLLMWAGLFAILSGVSHAVQTARRFKDGLPLRDVIRGELGNGLAMLATAYVYFLVLGPAILDRVGGNHDYAMIPNLIIRGAFVWPSLDRILYIDTLIMVAVNVVGCALVLALAWKVGLFSNVRRLSIVLGVLASVLVAASYSRIWLYPIVQTAIAQRDWLRIVALDYIANKNNPILPFLGFGLFGSLLGVRLSLIDDFKRAVRPVVALGAIWLVVGVVAYVTLPDTMLQRDIDPMWFTIMVAQVGLFLLLTVGFVRFFDVTTPEKAASRAAGAGFVRRFGVAGLSVFLIETPVRELLAKGLSAVAPGWNDTMGAALLFGAVLVVGWGLVLMAWERVGYAYSVERLLVRVMARFGKRSTKLEGGVGGRAVVPVPVSSGR